MVMPLSVLAYRLTRAPPSIGALISIVEQSEVMAVFLELVREFLPHHEQEIMAGSPWDRAGLFRQRFEEQYFPLADFAFGEEEELEYLVSAIPVSLGGWSYDEYHDFAQYRIGETLLLALVIYPWIFWDASEQGARIPILEECKTIVGPKVAARIPEKGWEPQFLRKVCDDTPYAGVADFAEWLCSCTGCWVLDASYEDYEQEQWSREIVDELTKQHPLVRERMDRVSSMFEWLEASPKGNFTELLNHLLDKAAAEVPEEQMPLKNGGKTLIEVFAAEAEAEADQEEGCHIGRMMRRPGM